MNIIWYCYIEKRYCHGTFEEFEQSKAGDSPRNTILLKETISNRLAKKITQELNTAGLSSKVA